MTLQERFEKARRERPTMNIHAEVGTKIVFAYPNAGYEGEIKIAQKHLSLGETYTLVRAEVHSWHTDVFIEEVPNVGFNSVMFREAK